jgi:hypothetical protein
VAWEPDYVTAAEVKAYLRIADTDDDALVALWATTASRAVDTFCHRQFGKVDEVETRQYRAVYDRHLGCYVTEIDDLGVDADMTVLSGINELLDSELHPLNAPQNGKPYERILTSAGGLLSIASDQWGWAAVPAAVKNASLIQSARFAARRDSPFGVAGSPTEGSEMRLTAALDPDLKTALGRKYRREVYAA